MKHPPLLIAHRGESFDAPENTLAAFDLAWQRGDDAIELDVQLTADKKLVVCHDADLLRTGGVKLAIAEQSFVSLAAVDVGRWKDRRFASERLPTLEAVLRRTPRGKAVFVELKGGLESIEPAATLLGDPAWAAIDLRVISFELNVAKAMQQHLPTRKAYWIVSPKPDAPTGEIKPTLAQIAHSAAAAGLAGVDLEDGPWITREALAILHEKKLECVVWTVDDLASCKALAAIGVDGITSNQAAKIRQGLF